MAVVSAILIGAVLAAAPAAAADPKPAGSAVAGKTSGPAPAPGATGVPGAAGTPHQTTDAASLSALAGDGYFYAYEHRNWDTSAKYCRWDDKHGDWRHPTWNMPHGGDCYNFAWYENYMLDNMASSVWNNGVPDTYDDVMMFRDIGWEGAKMCLGQGDFWGDLGLGWERFDDGGFANDEIGSHSWRQECNL
jgi:hypothetical protein